MKITINKEDADCWLKAVTNQEKQDILVLQRSTNNIEDAFTQGLTSSQREPGDEDIIIDASPHVARTWSDYNYLMPVNEKRAVIDETIILIDTALTYNS